MRTKFNRFWKEGFTEVYSPSLSASTVTFHFQYNTIDEYYTVLFAHICNELREGLRKSPVEHSRYYLYQMRFTPMLYNPHNFEPFKGIMIKYATI